MPHVCGLYHNAGQGWQQTRHYLPQVELNSHTTINPVCFTTNLTQTFHNPSQETLPQVRYTFPLYDGVAVNGYTITYGGKTIKGIVQQKDDAKKTYQDAVDRGETAGLLESLPAGVFGVTLGNLPAKTDVEVHITYCGELKHDAAIDGLRYMLPTSIAPRYGDYPGEIVSTVTGKGISITVDVDMAGSAIRRMTSPSHPISVSMGGTSNARADADFQTSQASASSALGTTELGGDFVLQLLIDDISEPRAILETHLNIPNQRAIMATLVPRFTLPPGNPEIVFIADQSGSMGGSKNDALVSALKVFIKSLPLGVRFNICAFGSSFNFLWPTSQAYSEANVNKAIDFVSGFAASYGGTQILEPIKAAFEQKLKDMPLEVMLLTDGEIWPEQQLFSFINDQVHEKKVDARVFALGIGRDVSHTLVEGVARAGNGFAQFVTQNEDTDQKVIRMLKAALYAHTKDYELEAHYADEDDADDFEIVEKVKDCLIIHESPKETNGEEPAETPTQKTKSFFDSSVKVDEKPIGQQNRYAHLPTNIETPKLLQAPSTIPPLFPFSRTTVYLLLGPASAQKDIKSITLRATSDDGPLELTVPVDSPSAGKGSSIHQLAARKAIQDLEEGRGWLQAATVGTTGEKAKSVHESRFDEIVEREAVKLGVQFQLASKWTSFVAVEEKEAGQESTTEHAGPVPPVVVGEARYVAQEQHELKGNQPRELSALPGSNSSFGIAAANPIKPLSRVNLAGGLFGGSSAPCCSALFAPPALTSSFCASSALTRDHRSTTTAHAACAPGLAGNRGESTSLFSPAPEGPALAGPQVQVDHEAMMQYPAELADAAQVPLSDYDVPSNEDSAEDMGFGLYDDAPVAGSRFLRAESEEDTDEEEAESAVNDFMDEPGNTDLDPWTYPMGECSANASPAAALSAMPISRTGGGRRKRTSLGGKAPRMQLASMAARKAPPATGVNLEPKDDLESDVDSEPKRKMGRPLRESVQPAAAPGDPLHHLIGLQTFSGAWTWSVYVFEAMGVDEANIKCPGTTDKDAQATALVIAYFENKLKDKRDVWEMVVEKARLWLASTIGGQEAADELVDEARAFV